jgi:4'-phosphopantetheinyl transferase
MKDIIKADEALSLPWAAPGRELTLKSSELHVWRANLQIDEKLVEYYFRILSPDEVERAERYYSAKDKMYFIAARGILRHVLARYLNRDQKEVRFNYGLYGKPFIAGEQNPQGLCFNVSHSDGLWVIAIGQRIEVGVDIERIRRGFDVMEIARSFFSQGETMKLNSLTEDERVAAFYRSWTWKEAYLKAIGKGLFADLREIDISGRHITVTNSSDLKYNICSWSLLDINPAGGYAGALASKGTPASMECFDYSYA